MKIEMDGWDVFWCVVAVCATVIIVTRGSLPWQPPECKSPKVIGKVSGKNADLYQCQDGRTIEIERTVVTK